MLNLKEINSILFKENYFWDIETSEEVKKLILSLFRLYPDLRKDLIEKIINPPYIIQPTEINTRDIELRQLNILEFLRENDMPIFDQGEKCSAKIYSKHPEWRLEEKNTDHETSKPKNIMMMPGEEVFNTYLVDTDKEDIIKKPLYQIGSRCAEDFNFCKELYNEIIKRSKEYLFDNNNKILWGLSPEPEQKEIKWNNDELDYFSHILVELISIKPDPEVWDELPSTLNRWYEIANKNPINWNHLYKQLPSLYSYYDYEISSDNNQNEWMQRAINHPYGKLTEIYIKSAVNEVKNSMGKEKHVSFNSILLDFFTQTIDKYMKGTRYGLCLISIHPVKYIFLG